MVGRCIPYWNSPVLGDMLVFGGVHCPCINSSAASESSEFPWQLSSGHVLQSHGDTTHRCREPVTPNENPTLYHQDPPSKGDNFKKCWFKLYRWNMMEQLNLLICRCTYTMNVEVRVHLWTACQHSCAKQISLQYHGEIHRSLTNCNILFRWLRDFQRGWSK